jgi:predicted RNA-binding protein YlqC (UPF0109 family)
MPDDTYDDDEFAHEDDVDGNVADVDEDDEDFDEDDEIEVGAEGNRIVGARARAVVEHVTRNVAEEPDAVDVEVHERGGEVQLLVHASQADMGRLIGKRGRVIQALRQVTRAAAASEGVKATVDVVE